MYKVDLYTIVDNDSYSYQISFVDAKGKTHERSSQTLVKASANQKELYAIIEALKALHTSCNIVIHTDSNYIVSAINTWLDRWQQNRFINAKGQNCKNKELWQEYLLLAQKHRIEVKKNGN